MTIVAQIPALIAEIQAEQKVNCPPPAAREFAIAITALEDAQIRHHRGMTLKGVVMDEVEFITTAAEQLPAVQLEDTNDLAESA